MEAVPALHQDPVADLVEELDRRDAAVRRVAGEAAGALAERHRVRPERALGAADHRFADQHEALVADVLHGVADEVLAGVEEAAVAGRQWRGALDGCSAKIENYTCWLTSSSYTNRVRRRRPGKNCSAKYFSISSR